MIITLHEMKLLKNRKKPQNAMTMVFCKNLFCLLLMSLLKAKVIKDSDIFEKHLKLCLKVFQYQI